MITAMVAVAAGGMREAEQAGPARTVAAEE